MSKRISFPQALLCDLFGAQIFFTNFSLPCLGYLWYSGRLTQHQALYIGAALFPIVQVALLFISRSVTNLPKWLYLWSTPGEKELFAKDEPMVGRLFDKYGWWVAAANWFAIRNRGMGLAESFSRPCNVWPENRMGTVEFGDGLWFQQKQLGPIRFARGWAVYGDVDGNPVSARPMFSLKWRPTV